MPAEALIQAMPDAEGTAALRRGFQEAVSHRHDDVLQGLEEANLDVGAWRQARIFMGDRAHPAAYLAHYGLEAHLSDGPQEYVAQGPRVPKDPPAAVAAAGAPWEDDRLDRALAASDPDYAGFRASLDPSAVDLGRQRDAIGEALDILAAADPGTRAAFDQYIQTVRLFAPGRRDVGVTSATAMQFFGALYLKVPADDPIRFYVDHILHETSHTHLHAMMGLDLFFTNDRSQQLPSALHEGPRSLVGAVHAAYVVARALHAAPALDDAMPGDRYREQARRSLPRLHRALDALDKTLDWTPTGQTFFDQLRGLVPAQTA